MFSTPPNPRSCQLCLRRIECISLRSVILAYSFAPFAFDNFLFNACNRLGDRCRFFQSASDPPKESLRHNQDIFFANYQDQLRKAITSNDYLM